MKKIKILSAIAVAASAMAATADTVVWYDFDGLGEAGTSVSHGTTIQNKANPGTLDATAFGSQTPPRTASFPKLRRG